MRLDGRALGRSVEYDRVDFKELEPFAVSMHPVHIVNIWTAELTKHDKHRVTGDVITKTDNKEGFGLSTPGWEGFSGDRDVRLVLAQAAHASGASYLKVVDRVDISK
jgi:hypothetical protein